MSLKPLADFVTGFKLADAPLDVADDGRRQLMDALGVVLAGSSQAPVRSMAKRHSGEGPSTLIGHGLKGDAADAAFVNAAGGVYLDLDTGQRASGSHPAIHAVPAALAIGEEVNATGTQVLEAILVGCEVGARVGVAAGRLRAGMSPHGGWAVIGASAAAARLLGYSTDDVLNTIAIASSLTLMSSTSVHTAGANVRHLQAGYGARNGILAARLHADGITGDPDGVATVLGGFVTPSFNPKRATVEIGSRWEFLRGYYKPYSCARFGHAAIDALLAIRADHPAEIASIDVVSYGGAAGLTEVHPTRPLAARFSLPHTLGAAWTFGHAGPDAFDSDAIKNPAIRALAEKVSLKEDTGYTALAPEYRPARVTVTFTDGSSRSVERMNARGEADDPDRETWLVEKFDSLSGLGDRAAGIRATIGSIENQSSIRDFLSTLG